MTIIETLRKELANEAITTEKMLSQIPSDKWEWQPHPKSMNIQKLANHISELPGWIGMVLNSHELDLGTHPYQPNQIATTPDILTYFKKNLIEGQVILQDANDYELEKLWTLREGEIIFSTNTKFEMLRMVFSQIIHHRAQLGVYLRLLNVKIPGSYGPSADEEGA